MDVNPYPARRDCDREPARLPLKLLVRSRGRLIPVDAFSVDVSPLGLRVQVEFELAPGQAIEAIANGDPASPRHCQVIWAKPPTSGRKGEAGLEFLRPDSSLMRKAA